MTGREIRKELEAAGDFYEIAVKETVTSTNTLLKEAAEQGEKEGTVLIAGEQTAGKGRYGRSFYSPKQCGI